MGWAGREQREEGASWPPRVLFLLRWEVLMSALADLLRRDHGAHDGLELFEGEPFGGKGHIQWPGGNALWPGVDLLCDAKA